MSHARVLDMQRNRRSKETSNQKMRKRNGIQIPELIFIKVIPRDSSVSFLTHAMVDFGLSAMEEGLGYLPDFPVQHRWGFGA
jgi:hypothetical protein